MQAYSGNHGSSDSGRQTSNKSTVTADESLFTVNTCMYSDSDRYDTNEKSTKQIQWCIYMNKLVNNQLHILYMLIEAFYYLFIYLPQVLHGQIHGPE